MPAPDFDLAVFGPSGARTTTTEALDSAMQDVLGAVWDKMHALTGRSLIDTTLTSSSGTAYSVSLPSTLAETPLGPGSLLVFVVGVANSGPATLSVNGGPAGAISDEDDAPIVAGMLISNRRYIVRQAGTLEAPTYRLIGTNKDLWTQIALDGVIATTNDTGAVNAAVVGLAFNTGRRLVKVLGTKFLVRFRHTNTGATTLSINGESPLPVLDADNMTLIAGDIRGLRRYIVRYTVSDGVGAYNLVTDVTQRQLNALAAGIGGGSGAAAEDRAHIGAWLDGTTIRGIGDDDGVVATLSGLTAISPVEGGRYASLVVNRPSIGSNTLVGGYPGYGLLAPAAPKVLHVVIGLGQSLIMGSESDTSTVTTSQPWPDDALMVDGLDVRLGLNGIDPLDPDTMLGFRPLTAMPGNSGGNRGETPMEGFAKHLTSLAREMNIQHRTLCFVTGKGGTNYNGLKKGTIVYANMLAALEKIKEMAEARGWRVIVDGCLVKHGESDSTNSGYAADLIEWQSDVDGDVKLKTRQTADVHFFVGQQSSMSVGVQSVLGMMAARGSLIHIAGADYPYRDAYSPDYLHMTGPGYHLIGEQFAMAWRDQFWRPAGGQTPVRITAASRSGTTVTLTYAVPSPPLVIDTTLISDPGQRGFQFFAGSTEIPITAVSVTDTGSGDNVGTIQLTLASAPSSGAERVDYALTLRSLETPEDTSRGNVRDSAPETSLYDGRRLYRWAPHQRVAL